jgi:hypothetical protein
MLLCWSKQHCRNNRSVWTQLTYPTWDGSMRRPEPAIHVTDQDVGKGEKTSSKKSARHESTKGMPPVVTGPLRLSLTKARIQKR